MRQLTSRSTAASASSVPSQDIEVSGSHAADERALRGTGDSCSRDRQQWLLRIVVAVVAVCAAILVAATMVRIGRMKSDSAASPLGSAHAFPAPAGTTGAVLLPEAIWIEGSSAAGGTWPDGKSLRRRRLSCVASSTGSRRGPKRVCGPSMCRAVTELSFHLERQVSP